MVLRLRMRRIPAASAIHDQRHFQSEILPTDGSRLQLLETAISAVAAFGAALRQVMSLTVRGQYMGSCPMSLAMNNTSPGSWLSGSAAPASVNGRG
jgi:hypothetical protein